MRLFLARLIPRLRPIVMYCPCSAHGAMASVDLWKKYKDSLSCATCGRRAAEYLSRRAKYGKNGWWA